MNRPTGKSYSQADLDREITLGAGFFSGALDTEKAKMGKKAYRQSEYVSSDMSKGASALNVHDRVVLANQKVQD